jgi:signal transduction histidine kinase
MGREREALRSEPLVASERDVVALVAHELRHPLAAIEMALPLLMDAPQRESRQKARRVVERQVVYLRRLVNDLLDAERARRGNLQLEQVVELVQRQ